MEPNDTSLSVDQFCRDLIKLGGLFTVDEEGYVVNKEGDDPVLCKVGSAFKRLMILKETIKDSEALVINPLNENISESPDSKWLYVHLSVGLIRRIGEIAKFLKLVSESESDVVTEEGYSDDEIKEIIENRKEFRKHLTTKVISFAAKHKDFDAKTLGFFEQVSKNKLDFMNVWYNRKQKESCFRCSVYNPDTMIAFPGITKKAWKTIISFMSDLLGLSNDPNEAAEQIRSKYTISSDLITVPKLESMLLVFKAIYKRLNRFLEMCEKDDDDFVVDMTSLEYHIAHLGDYYKKAHWFIASSNVVPDRPTIRPVDGGIPIVTSNIPSNVNVAQPAMVGYTEPESGIPSNPARHGIEYASYTQHAGIRGTQPMYHTNVMQPMNFGVQQTQFGGLGFRVPIR